MIKLSLLHIHQQPKMMLTLFYVIIKGSLFLWKVIKMEISVMLIAEGMLFNVPLVQGQ